MKIIIMCIIAVVMHIIHDSSADLDATTHADPRCTASCAAMTPMCPVAHQHN